MPKTSSRLAEFCLESPLSGVSGITGAHLKKGVVLIMTERVAEELGLNRKLLLGTAGLMAIVSPIVLGLLRRTVDFGPIRLPHCCKSSY